MELPDVRCTAIEPALALLPEAMNSSEAITMLLAIGLQESSFVTRIQYGNGPARSFWQMEKGGGVHGVLTHPASSTLAVSVCEARGVVPIDQAVCEAIGVDDVLAAAMARLLLWTDPKALPAVGDVDSGWSL